ncbi:MAG TPA: histidine phosphatase family protein [Desulfurivibrio alkaliphilus]|uniref:Histidine phosphatase family protein n=1 Tax=Desulfurivibrio alkaliphilus TaxID=427923 RepID=A0A7C2TLZ7_9BACT|nr:histidine phosphatase family protein [Desulfurivibrio alkaliphilus]
MKTLCLLRHAKSSWKEQGLNDFDRPLNKRGKRDAPEMAGRLRERAFFPQLILASPARRARKTAKVFAAALGYPEGKIVWVEEIYHADLAGLVSLLRGIEDGVARVLLVGHNPALTTLAEWLSGERIGNIPTCGLLALNFSLLSWGKVEQQGGRPLFYDYPKKPRPL